MWLRMKSSASYFEPINKPSVKRKVGISWVAELRLSSQWHYFIDLVYRLRNVEYTDDYELWIFKDL
jgi:hypothetical protein